MHDVEHESSHDDSAVNITELAAGEELQPRPFQDGAITKKPRLPRGWQYVFAGGTILLVLIVILASMLSSRRQTLNQSAHSRPVSVPTPISGSASTPRSIPTPAGNPIISPVWSDHLVSVTIADGVVYAGTYDNAVYALNGSNGSLLWRTRINGSVGESPVVVNGIVYANSLEGEYGPAHLYALRASDGAVLWLYSGNSYIYGPTVDSGVVYISSQGDGITALRASDGGRLWHFTTQQGADSQISSVDNGVLYVSTSVGGQAGGVIALRASDGRVLWRYTASSSVDTLIVSDGVLYLTSQSQIAALRASNGHQLWSQAIDATFYQSPQLFDGVLYLMGTKISLETPTAPTTPPSQSTAVTGLAPLPTASVNGGERTTAQSAGLLPQTMAFGALLSTNESNKQAAAVRETLPLKEGKSTLYAIRASDGTMLWQYLMNNGGDSFADWLQVENGVVYTSAIASGSSNNTGTISALQSSDGSVIWQDEINGSPSGTLLTDGVIYATVGDTSTSAVYALRANDGALVWSYPISGAAYNEPILDGTTVYVGAGNGMVYALRTNNGVLVWHYLTNVGS